jgi:DNA-binding response OmpR family regulator
MIVRNIAFRPPLIDLEQNMSKILIVDDDKSATALLSKIMMLEGYDSVVVNESPKTLEVAAEAKPDLFLLDLMMPDLNGFELCKLLRADIRFSHTPIVIVSAMDDSISRAAALKAGADDYVSKPFLPDDLIQRIKSLIEKS